MGDPILRNNPPNKIGTYSICTETPCSFMRSSRRGIYGKKKKNVKTVSDRV